MKTSSITLALILFTAILFGQNEKEKFSIEKGLWSIEGDISVNSSKTDYNENTKKSTSDYLIFGISPKIGFTISKNLVLGLGTEYIYSKRKSNHNILIGNDNTNTPNNLVNTSDSKSTSFSFFPYIKKFFPVAKKLAFHAIGETRFKISNYTFKTNDINDNNERNSKNNSFFIGIRPGVSYSLSKNILLQANLGSIGYDYIALKGDDDKTDQKNNSFGLNVGTSNLTLGLSLCL